MKVEVGELWVGDRFRALNALWTYLGVDATGHRIARKHLQTSIRQREKGFGHRMDPILSFGEKDEVEFVPIGIGFIDGTVQGKDGPLFPCNCKALNGDQCYNCLNGAHSICEQRPRCERAPKGA